MTGQYSLSRVTPGRSPEEREGEVECSLPYLQVRGMAHGRHGGAAKGKSN